MNRKNIISSLVTELSAITVNTFDHFKFLDEINDFPTICVYNTVENVTHSGGGIRYKTLSMDIRIYHMSDAIDSITAIDNLVDDVEIVFNSFKDTVCLVDSRIISLETDEGLFAPYGIATISGVIVYEQ